MEIIELRKRNFWERLFYSRIVFIGHYKIFMKYIPFMDRLKMSFLFTIDFIRG